jgi:hypothetical protein
MDLPRYIELAGREWSAIHRFTILSGQRRNFHPLPTYRGWLRHPAIVCGKNDWREQ